MDTTDPEIIFDANGVCSWCKGYEERKRMIVPEGEEKQKRLNEMMEYCRKAGKGKKHDCVIGVSGGVDSSFVAYKLKEFGLRPLAVHLDNGWNNELAVSNIHSLLKNLDIELYTYVLDWDMFRSLQTAFLRASTPDSEIPTDHAIVALMRTIANKEGIPVVWGVNFSSESILPRTWSQGHMDWGYIKAVNKKFGNKKVKNYPHYSVYKLFYWNRIKGQKLFNFLNYIEYDKEKAKSLLTEKYGWRDYGGKHHESIYTKFFQGYILPVKFGYDKRKAHFSSLILANQMTREQAIEELKKPIYEETELKEHLEYVPKKLGIRKDEFDNIMKLPIRKYEEFSPSFPKKFRNAETKIFNKISEIRRKLRNV